MGGYRVGKTYQNSLPILLQRYITTHIGYMFNRTSASMEEFDYNKTKRKKEGNEEKRYRSERKK